MSVSVVQVGTPEPKKSASAVQMPQSSTIASATVGQSSGSRGRRVKARSLTAASTPSGTMTTAVSTSVIAAARSSSAAARLKRPCPNHPVRSAREFVDRLVPRPLRHVELKRRVGEQLAPSRSQQLADEHACIGDKAHGQAGFDVLLAGLMAAVSSASLIPVSARTRSTALVRRSRAGRILSSGAGLTGM